MTTLLPPDHAARVVLSNEVHARPPEVLASPMRVTYVALLVDREARDAEHRHLAELCGLFGLRPPAPEANHFSASLSIMRLKWERHSEFSGFTFFAPGAAEAHFSNPAVAKLPPGWLAALPGRTLYAAHALLVRDAADERPSRSFLAAHFDSDTLVGSHIGGGTGSIYTDLRIHADGFSRILLLDRNFTERQAGRMLQRLFEIEAYRMLALLALPLAQGRAAWLAEREPVLAGLIAGIGGDAVDDETLLHELTGLAGDVEGVIAATRFRFGACAAYAELVATRIAELREERIPGIQTLAEFMQRRFLPAVATAATTSRRLHELSARVAQAVSLLSTKVGVVRERQNQALLESMNRRARLQLRLQHTVEGLSMAAILYYLAGLTAYFAKAMKAIGIHVDPDLAVGFCIVPLALLLFWSLRRARRHAADPGTD